MIEAQTSITKSRNLGAAKASGKIIVFIDDDTLLIDSAGLSKILNKAKFSPYGYGAVRHWTKDITWFPTHRERLKVDFKHGGFKFLRQNIGEPSPAIRRKLSNKYLKRSFIGNFGFIDQEIFKALGGFPALFKGYGIEDDAFSFLCYINYGSPAPLADIEVVHVRHSIASVCYRNLQYNQLLYKAFLASYGYQAFHIGDLLYPEKKANKLILIE